MDVDRIMKLQAEINGEKHSIEIIRDADKLSARVDDRFYELEASEPERNVYLLKHEGRIFEVFISPQNDPAKPLQARIGNDELVITLIDPKRLRGSAATGAVADGKAEVRTAMPGKVVRVLVEKGTEVKKGDAVIVVEAMKMQNEIKSPKDGVVGEIRFEEGSTVAAGDTLITID